MVERVHSPMLNRQQRDELVASLQSIKLLWEEAAGIGVVQNNIIIEILRVADDACKEGLSATRCVFYRELFQVLMDILKPQVWQNLSADEQEESKRLGLEVLNCAIDALNHEKEIKKEIVFLPYKASMWDSLESVWQAAYNDKEHCNAYVVPIPYADRKPDMTVAEWHCEADMFPDYVPVLDWQEYTLEKLNAMRPDAIFIHNPYDDCNRVTSVEPQYYSRNLKQCTDKLVYIPYYVCGEMTSPHMCQAPGVVNADYVIVQDENIKAQFEQHYPDGTPPEGKFLALGSPKFDKVLASKKEDFTLPESWQRIVKGKKVVLYNTSLGAALDNSDMVCKKLRYVFEVFKNRQDVALWWRPHPLMEATFRSMRPEQYAEYEQIVAEYKQVGWGIYDDTPELHRAIAYSDCYYGDDSSVVDLYKVTGKPVMIEDLYGNLQYRDKLPLISMSAARDENGFWLVSRWTNALLHFSIDTQKIDRMHFMPGEAREDLSTALAYVYGKVYIVPYKAKEFLCFDVHTSKFSRIDIGLSEIEKYQFAKFQNVTVYKDNLYLFGKLLDVIIIYDYKKNTYKRITGYHIEIDDKIKTWQGFANYKVQVNNKIYLTAFGTNYLFEYSLDTFEYRWHRIGNESERYFALAEHNGRLYLTNETCGEVIWDPRTNTVERANHVYFPDTDKVWAGSCWHYFIHGDFVIYFPATYSCMLYRKYNGEVKRMDFAIRSNRYADGVYAKPAFMCWMGDILYFQNVIDGTIYKCDFTNETFSRIETVFVNEQMELAKESVYKQKIITEGIVELSEWSNEVFNYRTDNETLQTFKSAGECTYQKFIV